MIRVTTEPLENEPDYADFTCGVPKIDVMVKSSYFRHILRQTRAYRIVAAGKNVGYYELSISRLELSDTSIEYADCGDGELTYAVVVIRYLAVDKRVQNIGIGSVVLNRIINQIVKLGMEWPIRAVVFDAIDERVEWYKNRGFMPTKEESHSKKLGSTEMYFDIMPSKEKQRISEYCKEYIEE